MKKTAAMIAVLLAAMFLHAEVRLGTRSMKDVVVLEPVDKTNMLAAITSGDTAALAALIASNALARAAIQAEASLRVAGDVAGTNHTDQVASGLATWGGATNVGFHAASTAMATGTAFYAHSAGAISVPGDADYWFKLCGGTATVWRVSDDTNRVYIVSANENYNGPSVGLVLTWDGDEYSYGAVLFSPLSTIWSLEDSSVIDAVWITSKFTLPADAYEANEGASGICTIDYVPITNSVQLLTAADVAALGYIRAADATNICNYLLPAAGCTANGTGATITMGSGSPPPIAYQAAPSGALAVSMDANAPRNRWYSLTTIGKAASSWPSGALVSTNTSGTSPFYYAIGPYTGTLWQVVGGGR